MVLILPDEKVGRPGRDDIRCHDARISNKLTMNYLLSGRRIFDKITFVASWRGWQAK